MQPKFSIIIPVYNVGPYLCECIESVLSQTFRDWEVVCVNDGSTDNSFAILTEYARRDSRVKVINQPNAGVVAARMSGFGASVGEYVMFLDGDDWLGHDLLSMLNQHIGHGVNSIIQYGFIYADGNRVRSIVLPSITGSRTRAEVLACVKESPMEVVGMCIWNKCYPRTIVSRVFNKIGDIRIAHSEDGLFALAAFWLSDVFEFIPHPYYYYRIRSESASRGSIPRIVEYKEIFTRAAVQLAYDLGGCSAQMCSREFNYHAREALGHIFVSALDTGAEPAHIKNLFNAMAQSDFFRRERSPRHPMRRKAMRFFITHPNIFLLLRSVLRHIAG